MLSKAKLIASCAVLLPVMLPTAAAAAQTAPSPPGEPAASGAAINPPPASASATAAATGTTTSDQGIGDIVVTANRRQENQQKVPISITAFKGETLTKLGIQSTVDLPQVTPGLSLTRTLVGSNAFLRGVGTTTAGYSTEVPIATYIDGLYLPNSAAAAFSFNNIERIEILKGPQGTLYGRNTTGGLIHIITREPDAHPSIDASVSYANYDTKQVNFYGSAPLSETLAFNVAALYINQSQGWGHNLFTGNEILKFKDVGFQGKLQWKPDAETKVTLRGLYDRTTTDQGVAAFIFPGSVGSDGSVSVGRYNINSRRDPFAVQRQYSVSLKAEHRFDFATLSSITGYINNVSPSFAVQSANFGSLTRSAVNLGAFQSAKTFSQELNLTSNANGSPFQWIVGAFYYRDKTKLQADVYGTCIDGVCARFLPPARTTGFQNTKSYAVYGEGTYSVTPATRITLGLRYTRDQKSLDGTVVPLAGFPNSIPAFPPSAVTRPGQASPVLPGIVTKVTFPKVTWKAVIAHDFTPEIHGFLSYNRGFKSGGYNPTSFSNPPSSPEVLDAFEIGVKSELFDRMLRLNASAFYYKYKDIQLRSTAPPAPLGTSLLLNAASAHIKGIDADFIFAPARGLTFNGGAELLDARYQDFPGGTCTTPNAVGGVRVGGFASVPCNLSGKRLPSSPKLSYTIGVNYGFDTSGGHVDFNVNDGYKADYYWEPDNRLKQKAFHLVNASVTWTTPDPRFSVQFFARNLLNRYYFASAAEGTGGNDTALPAAPRTYGAKVRYHF